MKEPDKQIFAMLKAYRTADVLKAIQLFKDGLADKDRQVREELEKRGWHPQNEKPENREFYHFDNQYWVQDPVAREQEIRAQLEMMQETAKSALPGKKTAQDMELKQVSILCPHCHPQRESKMYKQAVCPGCEAGQQGYKIRLICESSADHEVLL